MPELVPQVTLTKALTNNGTSTPPPNIAPPTTPSTGKTEDAVSNDGTDSFPFAPINLRNPQLHLLSSTQVKHNANAPGADGNLYLMLGASNPNASNDQELRNNGRPVSEAQTLSYTAMTGKEYQDEPGGSEEAAIDPLSRVRNSLDPFSKQLG